MQSPGAEVGGEGVRGLDYALLAREREAIEKARRQEEAAADAEGPSWETAGREEPAWEKTDREGQPAWEKTGWEEEPGREETALRAGNPEPEESPREEL